MKGVRLAGWLDDLGLNEITRYEVNRSMCYRLQELDQVNAFES